MQVDHYFILASLLLGIGITGALVRRNLISIIISMTIAGLGAFLFLFTVVYSQGTDQARVDGLLFGFCLELVLFFWIVIGCVLVYRRFISNGSGWINQNNDLRN